MSNSAVLCPQLTPSAVLVLSFLSKVAGYDTRASFYSRKSIAAKCGISVSSVVRAMRQLCELGLLKKAQKFWPNGRQKTNLCTLLDQPQISMEHPAQKKPGKTVFFKCDARALQAGLSGTEMRVYSYVAMRAGSKGESYLSKKEIAVACGVSTSTVYRAVCRLSAQGLLEVRLQTREDIGGTNATGENIYAPKAETAPAPKRKRPNCRALLLWLFLLHHHFFARVTPSPMSSVTPQRTYSLRKKNENLKRKTPALTYLRALLAKPILFFAGEQALPASPDLACRLASKRPHFFEVFVSKFRRSKEHSQACKP